MLWIVALLTGCAGPVEPPPAPAAPIAPAPLVVQESLGGVVQGAPFDPTGFECTPGKCEKDTEIAGLRGTLIVKLCGENAHQLGFQGLFYWPDAVAAQLGKPGTTRAATWTATLRSALVETGFVEREPAAEVTAGFKDLVEYTGTGRKLSEPVLRHFGHPDGRERVLTVFEVAGTADAAALDPNASMLKVTVSTTEKTKCTAGL